MPRLAYGNASLAFLLAALVCLLAADIAVTALNPWAEVARLVRGVLRPDLLSIEAWSVIWTVAFAVLGVGLGATCGFLLAIVHAAVAPVRVLATVLRSVHELFWALLLIQVFGLGATTGLLAIALPYTGFFAKVFSEMIEEADLAAVEVLPRGTSLVGLLLRPPAGAPAAVQDLHALPARMRPEVDAGARLRGVADDRVPPRVLLQAGALRASCGIARSLLRADRDASPVGAAGDAAVPRAREYPAVARRHRRRLGLVEPGALRLRNRSRAVARARPRAARDVGGLRRLAQRDRRARDRAGSGANADPVSDRAGRHGRPRARRLPAVSRRFAGRFGQPLGRLWLSWSARRPSTCWPTSSCSCSGLRCCRPSSR